MSECVCVPGAEKQKRNKKDTYSSTAWKIRSPALTRVHCRDGIASSSSSVCLATQTTHTMWNHSLSLTLSLMTENFSTPVSDAQTNIISSPHPSFCCTRNCRQRCNDRFRSGVQRPGKTPATVHTHTHTHTCTLFLNNSCKKTRTKGSLLSNTNLPI